MQQRCYYSVKSRKKDVLVLFSGELETDQECSDSAMARRDGAAKDGSRYWCCCQSLAVAASTYVRVRRLAVAEGRRKGQWLWLLVTIKSSLPRRELRRDVWEWCSS